MPEWAIFIVSALMANSMQALVALIWVSGFQRAAGPMSAALQASALEFVLVLPLLVSFFHVIGVFSGEGQLVLIRVDQWVSRLADSETFLIGFGVLSLGSGLIFVIQEVIPLWKRVQERPRGRLLRERRLDQALLRVLERFPLQSGWRGRPPRIFMLESNQAMAALHGILEPRILISSALLDRLDEQELEGAIAHELAHAVYGGNSRMILLWIARAIQAMNPVALIAFRGLLEQRERACDELAARVTGRPAALASALIVSHEAHEGGMARREAQALQRARAEVLKRIALENTRSRVRALLDNPPGVTSGAESRLLWITTAAVMGGLLWAIR